MSLLTSLEASVGCTNAGDLIILKGNPNKTIMIVPGYGAKAFMYSWLAKALNHQGYEVISIKIPNTLGSSITPWIDGIRSCIQTMNLYNVALVGHSLGGLASLLVIEDPSIKQVIALAPVLGKPEFPDPKRAWSKRVMVIVGDRDELFDGDVRWLNGTEAKTLVIRGGDHIGFLNVFIAFGIREIIKLGISIPHLSKDHFSTITTFKQHTITFEAIRNFLESF